MMDRKSVRLKIFLIVLMVALYSIFLIATAKASEKLRVAYISDSPAHPLLIGSRKMPAFKKYGLDSELIFINGSTRGIQSLMAGDLDFVGAVGTSAINGRLAGGDVVIVDNLVNPPSLRARAQF
jgi:ABC-type nitrate/sulfonate/bicarbonate transport system substrate-binding protein